MDKESAIQKSSHGGPKVCAKASGMVLPNRLSVRHARYFTAIPSAHMKLSVACVRFGASAASLAAAYGINHSERPARVLAVHVVIAYPRRRGPATSVVLRPPSVHKSVFSVQN